MRYIYSFAVLILIACTKADPAATEEVIYDFTITPNSVVGDGSNQVTVLAKLNKATEVGKRKIIFETAGGSFVANNTKTVTIEALFEGGELVARTQLKVPTSAGTIKVTARPEFRSPYSDYLLTENIVTTVSEPSSIKVEAAAFGVQTNYVGEVLITATLRNKNNKNVSSGTSVLFEDFFLNGTPANGRFRQVQSGTDENSKSSAYYSPGAISPGTDLYIRATVLDAQQNRTAIKDSVILTVIPN